VTNNKFRVWCRDYNEWEKDPIFLSQDGTPYHLLRGQLVAIKPHNHVVQFFTGLFDSEGGAICCGDLLQDEDGGVCEVYLQKGSYCLRFLKDFRGRILLEDYLRTGENVIVGNIFQNPELLKS